MQHTRDEPSFFRFISTILHQRYDPYCQKFEETTDGTYQHVLPAQHCRCGIPCGWNYTSYKMEERNITAVLSRFVNKKQLPTRYVNRKIPSYVLPILRSGENSVARYIELKHFSKPETSNMRIQNKRSRTMQIVEESARGAARPGARARVCIVANPFAVGVCGARPSAHGPAGLGGHLWESGGEVVASGMKGGEDGWR